MRAKKYLAGVLVSVLLSVGTLGSMSEVNAQPMSESEEENQLPGADNNLGEKEPDGSTSEQEDVTPEEGELNDEVTDEEPQSEAEEPEQGDVTDTPMSDTPQSSEDVLNDEEEPEEEIEQVLEEEESFLDLKEMEVSEGWYSIHSNDKQDLNLDVISSSEKDGAEIQLYKSVFVLAQRFLVQKKDNGWYTIQNVSSNKYLGVSESPAKSGSKVLQWTGNGKEEQEFKFYQNEDGAVVIQLHQEGNLVLDTEGTASGKKLKAVTYEEKSSQRFYLKKQKSPGTEVGIEEGTYRIYPSDTPGVSLDLWDASHAKGANVQIYTANGTAAQEWKISKSGSWYRITSTESSLSLDVKGGKSAAKTNLQQYTLNSGKGQFYRFYQTGEGRYSIMSKLGTVLDCQNGSTKSKTNVWMYNVNGTEAQTWSLEKIVVPAKSEKKLENGYYTISSGANQNLSMTVENESNDKGAKIQLATGEKRDSQIFKLESQSDGWYMLKNLKSGKYLDIRDGDNIPGTPLQQYTKNSTAAQKFKLYDAGNGQYYLKSKLGMILESHQEENGDIFINEATCSAEQKWVFKKTISESNAVNVANGYYTIVSGVGNSQVMDIRSGSKASGGNVQIYKNNSKAAAQNFYVQKGKDGWYTIQNTGSNLYLDVAGGDAVAKTNLQQYKGNGTDAQKFKFYDAGDGKYYLKSKLGTYVDVANGSSKSGTNVQMYTFNGTAAQKWTLKKTSKILSVYERIQKDIVKYKNVKYKSGGNTPSGWDCSGFTQWALKYLGVSIPRTAVQQAKSGLYISKSNRNAWKPGDILCYSNGSRISHVALYLGNGKIMHALSAKWDTLIQDVDYYEWWDSKTKLSHVRRYL